MSNASRDFIARLKNTLGNRSDLFDAVYRDPLHPKLLNRRALEEILNDSLDSDKVWSVTFADADGLKRVNDTYGHEVGDRFLQDIVDLWYQNTRSWDRADSLMFRCGGDWDALGFEDEDDAIEEAAR